MLSKAWHNFKHGDGPIFVSEPPPATIPTPSPTPSMTQVPLSTSVNPATVFVGLQQETQQAIIEAIAEKVPDLKKLLEQAALFAEDVPDFSKRLSIAMKSLRASNAISNTSNLLTGLQQATSSIVAQMQLEVTEEEREKITQPTEANEAVKRQRQALQEQISALSDQIGKNELSISSARAALQNSRQKAQLGIGFVNQWYEQMKAQLSAIK